MAPTLPGVATDFVREIARHLAAVRRTAMRLVEAAPGDASSPTDLAHIVARITRAQAVARQFVAFSRSRLRQPEPLRIADVLGSYRSMLRRAAGSPIRLTIVPPEPESMAVVATREGFGRVLMWLVGAATEALPFGGTVTIHAVDTRVEGLTPPSHTAVQTRAGAGEPTIHVQVAVTGFRLRSLRAPTPIEPVLAPWGASVTVEQPENGRGAYTVSFRPVEPRPPAVE
jgi:signal transduction histidine kinase